MLRFFQRSPEERQRREAERAEQWQRKSAARQSRAEADAASLAQAERESRYTVTLNNAADVHRRARKLQQTIYHDLTEEEKASVRAVVFLIGLAEVNLRHAPHKRRSETQENLDAATKHWRTLVERYPDYT